MLSRRHILGCGLATLGATAFPANAKSLIGAWPATVQLWGVNDQLKADLAGTLKGLKAAGFAHVETAGLHGRPPAEFRKIVEAEGLKITSAHVGMGDLIAAPDRCIDDAAALGVRWLYASAPKPLVPLPAGDWVVGMIKSMSLEAWKYNAEQAALIAPKAAKAGVIFGYHNHPMEFVDYGGVCGLDLILKATDPAQLRLQLDIGWVTAAGLDATATLKKYGARTDTLHIKDMVRDASVPCGFRSVNIGTGIVNWPAVLKEAHAQNLKGYVLDQETPFPEAPLVSLGKSLKYLKSL